MKKNWSENMVNGWVKVTSHKEVRKQLKKSWVVVSGGAHGRIFHTVLLWPDDRMLDYKIKKIFTITKNRWALAVQPIYDGLRGESNE